jgi:hypothetical protein
MRATLLPSSTATNGRAVLWKFERTVSLAVAPALVAVVASAVVSAVAVVSLEAVAALVDAVDLAVVSAAVVDSLAVLQAALAAAAAAEAAEAAVASRIPLLRCPRTHSLTLRPLAARRAVLSTFAT